jgi:hypothetical protein
MAKSYNLVVLKREENETVRVFFEYRLLSFQLFDSLGSWDFRDGSFCCWLLQHLEFRSENGLDSGRHVFFVLDVEVELLDGAVLHLQVLEA